MFSTVSNGHIQNTKKSQKIGGGAWGALQSRPGKQKTTFGGRGEVTAHQKILHRLTLVAIIGQSWATPK